MKIEIGKMGKILAGDDRGLFIKVQDDSVNTGGYLILTSRNLDMSDGHDAWVLDQEQLEGYFKESDWLIDWNLGVAQEAKVESNNSNLATKNE